MNEKEELIFGLKRWIVKAINYAKGYDLATLLAKEEMRFDAICYCIFTISDIAKEIVNKYIELDEVYPGVNFKLVSELYTRCISNENINVEYIYQLASHDFLILLKLLK